MPTSSARPERLRQFAVAVDERAARAHGRVAEVLDALRRYQIACRDSPAIGQPDAVARGRLDQARSLAGAVGQLAEAFAEADSGGGSSLSTANDLLLSRRLSTDHAGIATTALLLPQQHEEGRRTGARLAGFGPEPAAEALAGLSTRPMTSAYATGLVEGLGARGIMAVVARTEASYESHRISHTEMEAAMTGLTEAMRSAGNTLPAITSTPMPQQDKPAPLLKAPYALDLSIIERLGGSSRGQHTLRQLTLGASDLHPAVVASLAEAIMRPITGPAATWTMPSQGLVDRSRRRGLPDKFDVPILRLLRADVAAAGLWELGSPPGYSRLAVNLTRRTPAELDVVADIARSLYLDPVAAGANPPWSPPLAGTEATGGQSRTDQALAGIVGAVQGMDRPTPETARFLADLLETHPDFFDDAISDRAWETLEPDEELIGYFEVVSRDPAALRQTTDTIIERGAAVSADCLADSDPATARSGALRSCLQPTRDLGLSLERGAFRAGQDLDVVKAFGISVVARGAQAGVGAVAHAAGPPGALVGYLGNGLVAEGKDQATDRYAKSNDRLHHRPAQAMDRSLPYVAALAMAEDDRWRNLLADPGRLRQFDVVGSTADWESFCTWIDHQPPSVQHTLRALVSKSA